MRHMGEAQSRDLTTTAALGVKRANVLSIGYY